MCHLRSYRDVTIKDLHRKIHDLQRTNDMWKNKAKDLERKMLEVTVLQQKHEKRKAKTAALRVRTTCSWWENRRTKSKYFRTKYYFQNLFEIISNIHKSVTTSGEKQISVVMNSE